MTDQNLFCQCAGCGSYVLKEEAGTVTFTVVGVEQSKCFLCRDCLKQIQEISQVETEK